MSDGFKSTPEVSPISEQAAFDGIVCRRCKFTIADPEDRTFMDGLFRHHFVNPAGFEFEIGCFSPAQGCSPVGELSLEYTWFAGFAWSFAVCEGCDGHLGWYYHGDISSFYGLILDRLLPRL